jgi:hypothetical protein
MFKLRSKSFTRKFCIHLAVDDIGFVTMAGE